MLMNFPAIIPKPLSLEVIGQAFVLQAGTPIRFDPESAAARLVADLLRDWLLTRTGVRLPPPTAMGGNGQQTAIQFVRTSRSEGAPHPEGYRLAVKPSGVSIEAQELGGFVHGAQSLLQLLPETPDASGLVWRVPGVQIADQPRFGWRGMMLDTARHFFPVADIKKFIDTLATYKFNVFHWHLTEDQGWRIEIRRYPKLTSIGAWRRETVVGHASQSQVYDGRPHGGFYTQDELREIVNYAAARHITVMPEIEMPGHAQAALAAYPELSCTGTLLDVACTFGIIKEVYCAGNDATLDFVKNVLEEVLEIFPSAYIHIGGDECPKDRWQTCPKCQARIRALALKDEHELQSWFVRQMDTFLQARGRRLVGWDEILEGGLAPGAVVMSWRGEDGGIAAAKAGHDVIMATNKKTYFDHYQSADKEKEPLAIGGCCTLDNVYDYEPIPAVLSAEEAMHVLGAQGQLWSEYFGTWRQVEYMAFPRAAALAEVLWSPATGRDYADFRARLIPHLRRLDRLGVNYRKPE